MNPWNSLEIVKLIASLLTPLIVAIIAYKFNQKIKLMEKAQWTSQKIIEKRLQVFDSVVPLLNDILCFHCYVGNWKSLSASEIIMHKRVLDKELNVYSKLFNEQILIEYNTFMSLCFETSTGWGNDAKIKSIFENRKEYASAWSDSDTELFYNKYDKNDESNNLKEKKIAYDKLISSLAESLQIMQSRFISEFEHPEINFK